MTITLLLVILALVCFGLDAARVPTRIGLTPLGLAFCTFAYLLANMGGH